MLLFSIRYGSIFIVLLKFKPAPAYESLTNFSSVQSRLTRNRNLSYGSGQRQSSVYDALLPGHYLRLYTNKYN